MTWEEGTEQYCYPPIIFSRKSSMLKGMLSAAPSAPRVSSANASGTSGGWCCSWAALAEILVATAVSGLCLGCDTASVVEVEPSGGTAEEGRLPLVSEGAGGLPLPSASGDSLCCWLLMPATETDADLLLMQLVLFVLLGTSS